jgi:hypothetical protein
MRVPARREPLSQAIVFACDNGSRGTLDRAA